jgi:uncharacterized protein
MQINLEAADPHAIQAYSDEAIQINFVIYNQSLIVSSTEIIKDLTIKTIQAMDWSYLELLLRSKPEIILIGHEQPGAHPPPEILKYLCEKNLGMECMSVGAACRTYNVLLSERRAVVAGFIKS